MTGGQITAGCFLVPLLGCLLAIAFGNLAWLILLFPLMVFMEGGIALIVLAVVIVSWIVGG